MGVYEAPTAGVTQIALGATPIFIKWGAGIGAFRLNGGPSMVAVSGITGAVLADGLMIDSPIQINGPAQFYLAGAGNAEFLLFPEAQGSAVTKQPSEDSNIIAQQLFDDSFSSMGTTASWKAQSFTTQEAVDLASVKLKFDVAGSPTGTMNVEIRATDVNGLPTGAAITNGTSDNFDVSALSSGFNEVEFTFSTPPTLSGSTRYAIVLDPTNVTFFGTYIRPRSNAAGGYDGGVASASSNSGSTWSSISGGVQDFWFQALRS